ncbi:MAG: FAD binding domain-containing protein [Betaproteobacteria bacterium]|nr:FAD binding domain-containing protein [Betaproteobacteria bacterium]
MPAYARPARLDEALRMLAGGETTILAGGTDFYPAHASTPPRRDILDISAIRSLRGITEQRGHWRIGATTTWTEVIETGLPPLFDGLKLAAREIGGVQIQNRGTIAGNLCNASPAADGIPPLLALDAQVEIASAGGTRRIALPEFLLDNRRTALARGELATAVIVPKARHAARSHFLKLGTRKYLVISIVIAAATIEHEHGKLRKARIAVGACSPVARRLPELEAALAGEALGAGLGAKANASQLRRLAPIDDVRASGSYRAEAALTLVRRMLDQLGAGE